MAQPKYTQSAPETIPPMSQTKGQVKALGGAPAELPETILKTSAINVGNAPAILPPTATEIQSAEEGGIAAWHNGTKIVALWCNQSNRNAYISIPGLGWKKLAAANDSCVISMTMLASHAEQTNANVNIRTEADGMVHEIYVW